MHRLMAPLASAILSVFSLSLACSESAATQPQLLWTKTVAEAAWGCSYGVAVDTSGNLYTVGTSDGSVLGSPADGNKSYIAKYGPNGNLLWGRQWSSGGSPVTSVVADGTGGALVALGSSVKRFDSSGSLLWETSVSGAYGIALDPAGNSFVTGLGSSGYPSVSKINPSGTRLWTAGLNTFYHGDSWDIAVDASGNSVITGHSLYDGSTSTQLGFAARFSSTGSLLWQKQYGVQGKCTDVSSVAIDTSGGIYLSGSGLGLGTGSGLVKYDSLGSQLWFQSISGGNQLPIALDPIGVEYVLRGSTVLKFNPSGNLIDQLPLSGVGDSNASFAFANSHFGIAAYKSVTLQDSYVNYYSVPEPSALALLGLGSAVLTAFFLRRNKSGKVAESRGRS